MTSPKLAERVLPPYVSYRTYENYLDTLKEDGIPGRIDSSVLRNLNGATQSQLRTGMRFLGQIDENNVPTERLRRLVQAEGTERQKILRETLEAAYTFIFGSAAGGFDLNTATEGQFHERFRTTGTSGDTFRKCETFFLNAAAEAGIPISRYIQMPVQQRREPGRATGKRTSKARKADVSEPTLPLEGINISANGNGHVPPTSPTGHPHKPLRKVGMTEMLLQTLQTLVAKFPDFNPEWETEAQVKWFDSFERVSDRVMAMVEQVRTLEDNEEELES